jgi:hypothetical protein
MTDSPKPNAPPENREGDVEEPSPVLNDRSAEPGLPVGKISPDATASVPEEKKVPADVPVNPYVDPDMPGGVPLVPGNPEKPVDPKDPLPAENPTEPGIPTKEPSPDTTPS